MEVYLAGCNIDYEVIKEIKNHKDFKDREDITPETLSASYARISRDPRSVNILREVARKEVEKARKSNENIIFGLGHSSVAEHAVFNIDIIDISRYLSEYVEKFRLVSYTEKSQRYITLEKGYIIPKEIEEDTEIKERFISFVEKAFDYYNKAIERFVEYYLKNEEGEIDKKKEKAIELKAKEDARYLLPLSTITQLGMTINARNLENFISYLSTIPLEEARILSKKVFEQINGIAPSVIKYYSPKEYLLSIDEKIEKFFDEKYKKEKIEGLKTTKSRDVILIDYKKDFEDRFFAYLLVYYKNVDINKALYFVKSEISFIDKVDLLKIFFENLNFYDSLPRIFELIKFVYQITLSSSAYAQLKRHRMATNIPFDYDISLGYTIPEIFRLTNSEYMLEEIYKESIQLYSTYRDKLKLAANYFLINAQKRKTIFQVNLRELYHIAKLRLDKHAQWDIRNVVNLMVQEIRNVSPLIATILKGKDKFDKIIKDLDKLKDRYTRNAISDDY